MSKNFIKWSFVIFALLLMSCKKDVSDYAGRYEGTLTGANNTVKDNVELLFEVDASNEDILLFSGHNLTEEAVNQYTTTDKEAILKIVNMLYPDITFNDIYNTSAVFVFEKKELTMDLQYGQTNNSDNLAIRFIGKRK
jgi:hypothetical protein